MTDLNLKRVNMYELVVSLTQAIDLISPVIAKHHQQTAYVALNIAQKLKLPEQQKKTLLLAGLVHDAGALGQEEDFGFVEEEGPGVHDHAFRGAHLFGGFEPLAEVSRVIRFHHVPWNNGEGRAFRGQAVPIMSHLLHLADRIAVAVDYRQPVIGQIPSVVETISAGRGEQFIPEHLDAFLEFSSQESAWLGLTDEDILPSFAEAGFFDMLSIDLNQTIDMTKIFARIIDFRTPFTANHSAGVARTAQELAKLAGFGGDECKRMLIAGNLHDLGKLAVNRAVLESPDKLGEKEFNEIRSHTYYTYQLLKPIRGFETINQWASFHHEKLNGKGYPFHLTANQLCLGARIMAVADIFTAVSEDRPYREGMAKEQVLKVLESMVDNGSICSYVVSLLVQHYDQINNCRVEAQTKALGEYEHFVKVYGREKTAR